MWLSEAQSRGPCLVLVKLYLVGACRKRMSDHDDVDMSDDALGCAIAPVPGEALRLLSPPPPRMSRFILHRSQTRAELDSHKSEFLHVTKSDCFRW
jgi:hypothetical protein